LSFDFFLNALLQKNVNFQLNPFLIRRGLRYKQPRKYFNELLSNASKLITQAMQNWLDVFTGWSKQAPYFVFDLICNSNEVLLKLFQQTAELWKLRPPIVEAVETVLVSCPSIVDNMFRSGTFLAINCSNTNVEIVNDSSNHVGRYASDLPFYVVLQIRQSLGIVVVDSFLEVSPEKVVRWVKIR